MSANAAHSNAADPAVSVSDLSFRYAERTVLHIDDFRVAAGERVAVLGPSGCGKSTFLHLLAGLLRPTSGSITLQGQDLSALSNSAMDRFRGQHLGMVFQRLYLIRALTVRQNVVLARQLARQARDDKAVDALLAQLDLATVAQQRPAALSQGQAQRVAIARALVHRPQILLADEPTSALDGHNAQQSLDLLSRCAEQQGAALIVVTHDERVRGQLDWELELEAAR